MENNEFKNKRIELLLEERILPSKFRTETNNEWENKVIELEKQFKVKENLAKFGFNLGLEEI